jgi:hypothetical protein
MKLVITIDTEEDNWGQFASTGQTLENIERIPYLQEMFDTYNVRPTYLITYPVAIDNKCIALLGTIEKSARCEIGMHCHPWNTPPFEEALSARNSMLSNLPHDLQHKKMNFLHNIIIKNFGIKPVSFRSGRWGYNQSVAENLIKLGYKVDTSITSYVDWQQYYGPDFSDVSPQPFRFSHENIFEKASDGRLLEVPATVAYLQQNFARCNALSKFLSRKLVCRLRFIGILDKLHLLNKVWLSPEMSDSKTMIKLAKCMMKKKYKILNMFFHSTTLKAGLTDYVKSKDDETRFLINIKEFLVFAKNSGIESIKLSDSLNLFSVFVTFMTFKSSFFDFFCTMLSMTIICS